jgi:hypothetical protein
MMRSARLVVLVAALGGCGTSGLAVPAEPLERVEGPGWAIDLPVGLDTRRPPSDQGGQWTRGDGLDPDQVFVLEVVPRVMASVDEMVVGLGRRYGDLRLDERLQAGVLPVRHLAIPDRNGVLRDYLVFESGDRVAIVQGLRVPLELLMQIATTFEDTTP